VDKRGEGGCAEIGGKDLRKTPVVPVDLHVETLRWARANGYPWYAITRDQAAEELGYTDDFGQPPRQGFFSASS